MSSLINLDDVPVWLMCTIFFGVSSTIAIIVIIVCCCERRRRVQRARDYIEDIHNDEIEHIRFQSSPREALEIN